jgi:hypothetical protein
MTLYEALTRIRKVATPSPFIRRSSTHCCAAFVVSTTMKSSPPHAVDIAISYFAADYQQNVR